MKNVTFVLSLFAVCFLIGCANESEEELLMVPSCDSTVSLSRDAMPAIQLNCAVQFCHVAGIGLPDFRSKQTVLEYADEIGRRVRDGSMPPPYSSYKLSAAELEAISCWASQGGMDN